MRQAGSSFRAASIRTRTWNCRSAAPPRRTIFAPAQSLPRTAARRTIIDFAVQYKGESLLQGVDNWHKKAEGKCAIDYGFHLITTELEDKQIEKCTRSWTKA